MDIDIGFILSYVHLHSINVRLENVWLYFIGRRAPWLNVQPYFAPTKLALRSNYRVRAIHLIELAYDFPHWCLHILNGTKEGGWIMPLFELTDIEIVIFDCTWSEARGKLLCSCFSQCFFVCLRLLFDTLPWQCFEYWQSVGIAVHKLETLAFHQRSIFAFRLPVHENIVFCNWHVEGKTLVTSCFGISLKHFCILIFLIWGAHYTAWKIFSLFCHWSL